jgi:Cu+-exporting ATPase
LIRQNLILSLIYNLIALPLAVTGFVIPLVAALSMSFSSLLVVLNSLRSSWQSTPSS